jgi:ABC-2 type transport system permease protein
VKFGLSLAPAGLPGLVLHTMRIGWRAGSKGGWRRTIVVVLVLGVFVLAGLGVAVMVRDTAIGPSPPSLTVVAIAALVLFSFALSQALSRAEATLYGSGDLDLLLSAPIPTRTVLWAKLLGIAGTVLLSEAFFVLPPLLPVIVFGHPALAGAVVVLLALVLVATCLGLAVMLAIVRLAGPRAARTVAQVTIALCGGAFVIASQAMRYGGGSARRNGFGMVYRWARARGFGQTGLASLPGRAALGDPLAGAVVVAAALALFALTGWLFERYFVAALQQGGQRAAPLLRSRVGRSGMRARFSASLVRTILAKELALLVRNPQLLATMLLRLVYLVPMMLVLLQQQGHGVLLPAMVFVAVFVTTQLTGDLAWLVTSGEDTPDLLMVAPVARAMMGRAKVVAAVVLAAPILTIGAIAIGSRAPLLVLVVLPAGLAGAMAAAQIQLALEKPTPRKAFGRRTQGASIAANLLVMVTALILGAIASALAWWVAG